MTMMMLVCMLGVAAVDSVVRRSEDAGEFIPSFGAMKKLYDLNDGVCEDRHGHAVFVRTSADEVEEKRLVDDNYAVGVKPLTASAIRARMARYEKKFVDLMNAIEYISKKVGRKGQTGRAATFAGYIPKRFSWKSDLGTHLDSKGVDAVLGRIRGFEKCRGFLSQLADGKVDQTEEAKTAAAEFRAMLTEGDDCCDSECHATLNGGMKWVDGVEESCNNPCMGGCAVDQKGDGLKLFSEMEVVPISDKDIDKEDPKLEVPHRLKLVLNKGIDNDIRGIVMNCSTVSDETVKMKFKAFTDAKGKTYNRVKGKYCWQQCSGPDGQCRGLKSIARRAATELSITLSFDVCPAAAGAWEKETVRKDSSRICGPFAPATQCRLNMENIIMRGDAHEVWQGDYLAEKAFGKSCIHDEYEQRWFPGGPFPIEKPGWTPGGPFPILPEERHAEALWGKNEDGSRAVRHTKVIKPQDGKANKAFKMWMDALLNDDSKNDVDYYIQNQKELMQWAKDMIMDNKKFPNNNSDETDENQKHRRVK